MPVPTFDATVSARATSTGLTVAHTCTGTNRLLVVNVLVRDQTAVNGVTYAGVSMTRGPDREHAVDTLRAVQFYLPNPASGANNIVAALAASSDHRVDAVSYTGAHQTTPLHNSNSNEGTGTSTTVDVVTSVANCIVVDGFIHESPAGGVTVGANQTSRQNLDNTSWVNGTSEEAAAAAATITMSWSGFSSDTWVAVTGAYVEVGGAAATSTPPDRRVNRTKGLIIR